MYFTVCLRVMAQEEGEEKEEEQLVPDHQPKAGVQRSLHSSLPLNTSRLSGFCARTMVAKADPSLPMSMHSRRRCPSVGFSTTMSVCTPRPSRQTLTRTTVISSDRVLPSALNGEIFAKLQSAHPGIFAHNPVSFDGRKNAYAAEELELGGDSREFDVNLTDGPASVERPPKIYKVRLTLVAKINNEILQRFITGQQSSDNTVSTALQALNVVTRMHPSSKHPSKGRSFFTLDNTLDLRNGLLAVRGYFQSIRPGIGKMLLNVDISTGVVYKAGKLIDLCLAHIGETNIRALSENLDERSRLRLGRFIAGVRVQTRDAGNSSVVRTRVIRRLHRQGADKVTFVMRAGGTKTVAEYFQQTTGRPLQFPWMLCVEVGQGALIPLELCQVVPGQLVKKEIPDDKKRDLVRFASVAPNARLEDIRKGLNVLAYGQSEYVRKFGIKVNPQPLETTARVLDAPKLRYSEKSKVPVVQPRNGSWNMADKRFYRPAMINNWALVILDSRFPDTLTSNVVEGFVKGCTDTGMVFKDPKPVVQRKNPHDGLFDRLTDVGKEVFRLKNKAAPALFVVILPQGGNDVYTNVKHWGDVLKGVPTQCLKPGNVVKANLQFWANVALKVNVKMGGINVITDPEQVPILSDPRMPTIVLGADVQHPGAGTTGRPSYAAVVGSKDSNAASYVAIHGVQASRQELITDLQSMTKYVIQRYMNYRVVEEKIPEANKAPKRLFFFRDGVSEGQFQQVLDHELPLIKGPSPPFRKLHVSDENHAVAACTDLRIKPAITLVIVGKRHHIRVFPKNPADADRSGNLPAGTVVDRDVGHPTAFDYYLQSHGGLLGTSRPGHYSVLYDENGMRYYGPDSMQTLSFALCHVYAGSTRSVSYPAPTYYADRVCARAKIHFDPSKREGEFSETASSTGAGSETLETFKSEFKPLNSAQRDRMYFS
ncbi:Argonaute-like protein [Mycena kentingensis (nom. inval.)]|nr:Argonaute-like protein [Mycena kentingensis (nom. inval.)]